LWNYEIYINPIRISWFNLVRKPNDSSCNMKIVVLILPIALFFPSKITLLNNLWGRGLSIVLKLSPALRIDLSGTLQFLVIISSTLSIQHSNSVNFSDCLIAEKKESTRKKEKKLRSSSQFLLLVRFLSNQKHRYVYLISNS